MTLSKEITDKLIKHFENLAKSKHLNPVEFCKKYGHTDSCICITPDEIWWKCKTCGHVKRELCGPMTTIYQ